MTKITITPTTVEARGHSPDSVVCHGISSMMQMVGNYMMENGMGTMEVLPEPYLRIKFYSSFKAEMLWEMLTSAMENGFP